MQKINVLVLGSGAREHAIAESIFHSPLLGELYQAGRDFPILGKKIEYENFDDLVKKCVEKKINLAIIGPEEPICDGIADVFKAQGISVIAVSKEFSQLESSKLFAKKFMEKHGIKTAKYRLIKEKSDIEYDKISFPFVLKADGLCQGKGVVIARNKEFAQKTIDEFLNGKFGENSKTILLEEFIQGDEISLMSLWDGKNLLSFAPSKDFKKLNKSESAPNTGGMGSYCPYILTEEQQKKLDEYLEKLKTALLKEKADFTGFIYSGLIWSQQDWLVLEYNVRLGDPEAQSILTHLKTDFLSILIQAPEQTLDKINVEYKSGYSACLVVAAQGYPKTPKDGEKIEFKPLRGIKVFFAGVKEVKGELLSKGGRILSLCTTANEPFSILKHYAKRITMKNKYFRDDIDTL